MRSRLMLARLQRARAQLHPEFVFGTLQSISAMMEADLAQTEIMISRLGTFLRSSLEIGGASSNSVRQELRMLRAYLDIERMRRCNCFEYSIDVDVSTLQTRIPCMSVFPVVQKFLLDASPCSAMYMKLEFTREDGMLEVRINVSGSHLHSIFSSLQEFVMANLGPGTGVFSNNEAQFIIKIPEVKDLETASVIQDISVEREFVDRRKISPNFLNIQITSVLNRKLGRIAMLFIAWSLLAIVLVGRETSFLPAGYPVTKADLIYLFGIWYLWAAATPVVLVFARRFPVTARKVSKNLLRHFVMNACIWASIIFISNFLFWVFASDVSLKMILIDGYTRSRFSLDIILYWTIIVSYNTFHSYRKITIASIRAEDYRSKLIMAQVQSLRMKLHPHFLFNALNSLSELMHQNLDAAKQMLERLETFFAFTLKHSEIQMTPLRDELEFMACYLDIQYVRFGDRLTVDLKMDPHASNVLLPNLFWQPLVENAIRHGISQTHKCGNVKIRGYLQSERFHFEVEDNGPGINPQGWKDGFGISNTRELLELIYGKSYTLRLQNGPSGGVLAIVEIPYPISQPLSLPPAS